MKHINLQNHQTDFEELLREEQLELKRRLILLRKDCRADISLGIFLSSLLYKDTLSHWLAFQGRIFQVIRAVVSPYMLNY